MSRRRLPPLKGLLAFETVARTGSFQAAAAELNVTRSAVSHQIRALEESIGITLFDRNSRPARLSDAGQVYFTAIGDLFDGVEQTTRALAGERRDDDLVIQIYVTVALKWLIPRLHDFERTHPQTRVRLSTSYVEWDFDRANADVGLILARRREPGLHYRRLFRAMLAPVCSPALLGSATPALDPSALADETLLEVWRADEDWNLWLDAAGVPDIAPTRRVAFDSYALAQQAAVDGQGFAMTLGPFASEELKAGQLAQPFDLVVPHAYWWELVCDERDRDRNTIRQFADWLGSQVRADPQIEEHS